MASHVITSPTLPKKAAHNFRSLIDERFTRLVVKSRAENTKRGQAQWNCVCDCGERTVVITAELLSEGIKSCGCLRQDTTRRSKTTHGKRYTPEWNIWRHMKGRCLNPQNHAYADYGGRGITVCDEWQRDFSAFLADVGPRPGPGYSIERKDNSKDYEPGNTIWATPLQQSHNKRNNRNLTFQGRTQCLSAWAKELSINRTTLRMRKDLGWSTEKALMTPIRRST